MLLIMAIYPVEFCRRAEKKWRLRSASARQATEKQSIPGNGVLLRWPALVAIGQELRSRYAAVEQSMPKPLAALLKKLHR
jgi:hypothetical protein